MRYAPTGDFYCNQCMKVIWHHYVFIQRYLRSNNRRPVPFRNNNSSRIIQNHRTVSDIAKNTCSVVNGECYEISAGIAIVVV